MQIYAEMYDDDAKYGWSIFGCNDSKEFFIFGGESG